MSVRGFYYLWGGIAALICSACHFPWWGTLLGLIGGAMAIDNLVTTRKG